MEDVAKENDWFIYRKRSFPYLKPPSLSSNFHTQSINHTYHFKKKKRKKKKGKSYITERDSNLR